MRYYQITAAERYTLALLRRQGLSTAAIARVLGRHRSTIGRELQRNRTRNDGHYRAPLADWYARGRRSRSRRNQRFTATDWRRIHRLVRQQWSPEQIAGRLRRDRVLAISHETIYRAIWADKAAGGSLYLHLRGARKRRRKRDGRYEQVGHWEADTVLGAGQAGACLLTLVERKTGYLVVGALRQRTTAVATPHHAWERGTNENTNGLLRQYVPKGHSLEHPTQRQAAHLARTLNSRPRKRLAFRTPEECYDR